MGWIEQVPPQLTLTEEALEEQFSGRPEEPGIDYEGEGDVLAALSAHKTFGCCCLRAVACGGFLASGHAVLAVFVADHAVLVAVLAVFVAVLANAVLASVQAVLALPGSAPADPVSVVLASGLAAMDDVVDAVFDASLGVLSATLFGGLAVVPDNAAVVAAAAAELYCSSAVGFVPGTAAVVAGLATVDAAPFESDLGKQWAV